MNRISIGGRVGSIGRLVFGSLVVWALAVVACEGGVETQTAHAGTGGAGATGSGVGGVGGEIGPTCECAPPYEPPPIQVFPEDCNKIGKGEHGFDIIYAVHSFPGMSAFEIASRVTAYGRPVPALMEYFVFIDGIELAHLPFMQVQDGFAYVFCSEDGGQPKAENVHFILR